MCVCVCVCDIELQLKAEHKLMHELTKWYSRTVEMLTEADPRGEEPVFKWRRNVKVSVDTERQVGMAGLVQVIGGWTTHESE